MGLSSGKPLFSSDQLRKADGTDYKGRSVGGGLIKLMLVDKEY